MKRRKPDSVETLKLDREILKWWRKTGGCRLLPCQHRTGGAGKQLRGAGGILHKKISGIRQLENGSHPQDYKE